MARLKPSFSMSIILIVTLVISFMESGLTLKCYTCDSRHSKTCESVPTKEELQECKDTPEPTSPTSPDTTTTSMSPPISTSTGLTSESTEPTKDTPEPTSPTSPDTPTTSMSSSISTSTDHTSGSTEPTTVTGSTETSAGIVSTSTDSTVTESAATEGTSTSTDKDSGKPDNPGSETDNSQSGQSKSKKGEASSSSQDKESSNSKQHSNDKSEEKKLKEETASSLSTSKNVQNRFRRSLLRKEESPFMCAEMIGTDASNEKVVIRKCVKKSPAMCGVSDLSSITRCTACDKDACNSIGVSISFGIMSMLVPIATIVVFAR